MHHTIGLVKLEGMSNWIDKGLWEMVAVWKG